MKQQPTIKYYLKKIIKFLPFIGVILLLYIMYNLGFEEILQTFIHIPLHLYLFSILIFIPKLFLATYKWQYINKKQKIRIGFWYLAKCFMTSLFYGSVTPGTVGIHIRIYYIKKKAKASLQKCIANSFLDATLALLGGLFLAIIGASIYLWMYPEILPVLVGFFILYSTVFIFFLGKKRGSGIIRFFIRPFLPRSQKDSASETVDLLYEDIPKLSETIIPFLLELVIWSIAATQVYALSLAFSIPLPFLEFILISIVSVVIGTVIPISIGGLGVREGAFVVFLAQYGVSHEIAFVLSLAGFLVKNLIPGIIGLLLSFHEMRYVPQTD